MTRTSRLFLWVLVCVLAVGSGGAAVAQQDDGAVQLRIDAPAQIPSSSEQLVPISAIITSPRALRGTLIVNTVTFGQPGPTYTVPVDVAAGAVVNVDLAVPTTWGELRLSAEFVVDGDTIAEATVSRFSNGQAASLGVGVLGLAAPTGQLALRVGTGTNTATEVSVDSLLSVGLAPYATVVVEPASFAQLPPEARNVVLGWTASGGDLIVDGPAGSIDAVLDASWRATTDTVSVGVGRIRYTTTDWPSLVEPAGSPDDSQFGGQAVVGNFGIDPMFELASDAGLRLPGIRTTGLLLFGYVIVAGPLAYLLARRLKRTHVLWVALPAVAVVFTVSALIVGSGLRSDRGNAHATIVEVWPQGSSATTTALFTSTRGGDRTVDLPAGWSYVGSGSQFSPSGVATLISPSRSGTQVTFDLATGGTGSGRFSGPTPQFDGALTIDNVTVDGLTVSATVTNNSAVDLVEVVALAGTAAVEVGDLAAGASTEFDIDYSNRFAGQARELALWPVQNQFFDGFRQTDPTTPVSGGAWAQWRQGDGWNTFTAGVIGVAGWTRDLESPVGGVTIGRTALVARANVPLSTSVGSPVPLRVVSDPGTVPQTTTDVFAINYVQRGTVPADFEDQVTIEVGRLIASVEFWVDGQWRPIELDGDTDLNIQVPSEAISDGEVWIRSGVISWDSGPRPSIGATLGTDGDVVELKEPGSVELRSNGFNGGFGPVEEFVSEVFDIEVADATVEVFEGDLFGGELDQYNIELAEGDSLVITLSAAHDSFLRVTNADGAMLAENDDFPQCCNSGLTFIAPSDGTYIIEARSLGSNGQGAYELVIDRSNAS